MSGGLANFRRRGRTYDTMERVEHPPSRPLIIYDGECNFCRRQVRRLQERDRAMQFEYAARQLEGLDERFPLLAASDFNTGMRLIDPHGRVFVGADAAYEIARRLPGYRRIAWLYRLPVFHQVAKAGYALVARYRYKFAGKCEDGACGLSQVGSKTDSSRGQNETGIERPEPKREAH